MSPAVLARPGIRLAVGFLVLVTLCTGVTAWPAVAAAQPAPSRGPSSGPGSPPPVVSPSGPPSTSEADTARLVGQARAHFDAGNQHYAAGRFEEAIKQFQAGYALVPRPNFLVNLGQAYRKLGDLVRAKEAYLAYVRALPQNSALRDQALQVLAEIEVQLQERKGTATGDATTSSTTEATGAGSGGGGNEPAASVPVPLPPLPESERSQKANVLAMVVAGGGLALAGGGLVFQLRAKNASDRLTAADRNGEMFDPELDRQGRRDQRIGIGLLAAGGAALATAITLYMLMGPDDEPPGFAIGPGGVQLGLRF